MLHEMRDDRGLWNRRHVLKAAGGLAAGSIFATTALAEQPPVKKDAPFMQIGIFLETFARPTLEARLDAVKANGLDCVQLQMTSAGLPTMPDAIAPELLARIRREAEAREIEIGCLQGTFNMCHPDADYRRAGVRGIGVLAAACEALGTAKIHICSGTRNRGNMWRPHPDNDTPEAWTDMVDCMRSALDVARPFGVTLAFEPEVNNVIDSAKKAKRLMFELCSPRLKVTMDAANLFHAGELPRMSEVLDEAFELVGPNIVMAHAKDLSHDGDAGHEPAGHGKLDYVRYLSLLHACGFKGPLFLHGLSEAQVPGCLRFVRDKLARVAAAATQGRASN